MFIYQIGNVVMRGFATHSTPVKWRNTPTQNMTNSIVKFNSPYSLPETASYSISGELTCYKGLSPTKLLKTLTKLGGRPYIDVIGYLPNDCCRSGCVCDACAGEPLNSVRWFHTYGVVNSVSREYVFDDSEEPLLSIPVSVDISANPYWTPLNKMLWFPYYSDDQLTVFELDETNYNLYTIGNVENTVNGQLIFSHPKEVVPFHYEPQFVFYKRRFDNEYELYNPAYWSDLNLTGVISGSSLSTGAGNSNYYVSTEYSHIESLICFSGFDSAVPATIGTLTIEVDSEITPFTLDNSVSTLDIATIESDLNEKTLYYNNTLLTATLDTDFLLYVGLNNIAPSFMTYLGYVIQYHNGIPYVPSWTYKHRHPGELNGTNNHVVITKPDTTIEVAYLHKFVLN